MNKRLKLILLFIIIELFLGCIPMPQPQIVVGGIKEPQKIRKEPIVDKEYGAKTYKLYQCHTKLLLQQDTTC